MSVWNEKGYSDFQALKPKVDDLMAWELGNEFDSLPPTSQQTNDLLNIEELRETIRLAEHQLLQYKMQLCRLILGHYRSLNALFNETEKTVGMAPRFDGFDRPVSCSNSTDCLSCSDEDSPSSEFVPANFTTHVVRENDILTVYCGNVHASVTLD
ncbi:hypothetical protein F5878DRAFT_665829 [Lentinula raphanica]|uniref:Uncharacterized protein n=1 Tax=Lentinula raphanica TaxID=153919 RepID=A0AA38NYZ8_9AGAR|nr:hypothetical protein C8R42DRAFT_722076 [Lentinula raphanica]KAJ3833229.1 hypothetical protein F5878DRAFT_665829 [Lentinula raphanica]